MKRYGSCQKVPRQAGRCTLPMCECARKSRALLQLGHMPLPSSAPVKNFRPDTVSWVVPTNFAQCRQFLELPQRLGRLLDHNGLEVDDLPALLQRQPALLRRFEVLRDIKWNQPRHCNPPRTGHPKAFLPVCCLTVRFRSLTQVTGLVSGKKQKSA